MVEPNFQVDLSAFNAGLAKLLSATNKSTSKALSVGAFGTIAKAQRRAPVRFGALLNSARVDPVQMDTVRFGFNLSYADVMDRGWRVSVIKPKRAKVLVIPISRRAARQGSLTGDVLKLRRSTGGKLAVKAGRKRVQTRNPITSTPTSVAGKTKRRSLTGKEDFIFALSVVPRKAQKGSRRGPNYYFSGTLRDVIADGTLLKTIGQSIKGDLGT